jgi:hypothetical protein
MAAADAVPTTPPTGKSPDPEEPIKRAEYASAEQLSGFLMDLGSTGEIKLELFRKSPPTYQGIKIDGHLRNYSEPFTIEEISEEHGGGKFQVRCQKRNANTGRWQYAGARTFDVAGVAKIDALRGPDSGNGKPSVSDPAVSQALNMAATVMSNSQAEAAALRAEARDGNNRGSMDEGTKLMITGMQEQLAALREDASAKDAKILELIGQKPDTSGQDKLFGIMEKSTVDHSSRITEIRTAHDSELRQLRDFHNQDLRLRESRFEKELDAVRAGHVREIDSLKDSNRVAVDSQKLAYEMKIDVLKDQIKRGDRDLTETKAEVGALRGKKDLSPMDQLDTIVKLKNGLESVFPTGGDEEPSKLQQIVTAVAESPIVASLAARIEGPGGPGGGQQLEPGDRMVKVRGTDGQIHEVPESYVRKMQEQQAAQRAEAEANPMSALDPAELKQAVTFLETAYEMVTRRRWLPRPRAISCRRTSWASSRNRGSTSSSSRSASPTTARWHRSPGGSGCAALRRCCSKATSIQRKPPRRPPKTRPRLTTRSSTSTRP